MSKKAESSKADYIRLLNRSADVKDADYPDAVFAGELIEEGYLTGVARRDEHGVIRGSVVTGITVKGRLFLEQLKKEEKEARFASRLWKACLVTLGWILGIVSAVSIDFLKDVLKL